MEFGKKIRMQKRPFRRVKDRVQQRIDHEDYARSDARPEVQERLGASESSLESPVDMQGEQQRLLLQRLQRQRALRRQQGLAQAQRDELREVVDANAEGGGALFFITFSTSTVVL